MFKGVHVISRSRSIPYVCDFCSSKGATQRTRGQQRRWLSRNYIANIKNAEQEWAKRASSIRLGEQQSMLSLLEERGYVNQIVGTHGELDNLLTNRRVGAYCGVDPTAPSLHVGHMVPLMVLGWLYIHGYSVNFILGGATVKIGDPTDRLKERQATAATTRKTNMASMHVQLKRLGELMHRYAERRGYAREWAWHRSLINNNDWYEKLPLMEFLKLFGKGARIGPMLGRDTVKNRLEKGDGMSFSEFTYPLIQAYDWWVLYQKGVQIQVGGADQFGNILAGADMVKYMAKHDNTVKADEIFWPRQNTHSHTRKEKNLLGVTNDPIGFTTPLLTTASGDKFGKSAGNAVWLDRDMTPSFDLYQFFLRSADADVERYLNLLTFVPTAEIEQIMVEHNKDQSKRVAQHKLAREFVELVHGLGPAEEAEREHRNMFSKDMSVSKLVNTRDSPAETGNQGTPADINPSLNKHAQPLRMEDNMSNRMKLPQSLVEGRHLSQILWSARMTASRSEGQRLINNKGVLIGAGAEGDKGMSDSLSFHPAQSGASADIEKFIIDGKLLILRIGKWKVKIIDIVPDQEFEDLGLSCPGWGEPPLPIMSKENEQPHVRKSGST